MKRLFFQLRKSVTSPAFIAAMRVRGIGNALRLLLTLSALFALLYGSILSFSLSAWVNDVSHALSSESIRWKSVDGFLEDFSAPDNSLVKRSSPSEDSITPALFLDSTQFTIHSEYLSMSVDYSTFPQRIFTEEDGQNALRFVQENIVLLYVASFVITFVLCFMFLVLASSGLALSSQLFSTVMKKKRSSYTQAWSMSAFTLPLGTFLYLIGSVIGQPLFGLGGVFVTISMMFLAIKKLPVSRV
ncbi:DUF1189 family protein [Aureibacillus halotolerans]|uniref:Uncharacterized protein DUF1189 n=1 Tax=Aureibacillus halotolerans TaxID=1508390 RepID=A0A4R6U5F7_9BACI|nr:DUF1189 family protein [Aureibacillus halotolerans]TDQ41708.1 uncharacterized protein DUF1189 [Aureibacillus halotolerans]